VAARSAIPPSPSPQLDTVSGTRLSHPQQIENPGVFTLTPPCFLFCACCA
jgi:hypothetical protein